MGFNWKAFGAAFLDKQTEGIKKRRTDAEEFEDKEEELAKANRKAIPVVSQNSHDRNNIVKKEKITISIICLIHNHIPYPKECILLIQT